MRTNPRIALCASIPKIPTMTNTKVKTIKAVFTNISDVPVNKLMCAPILQDKNATDIIPKSCQLQQ